MAFFIKAHMFDETKLPFKLRRGRVLKYRTVAQHGQAYWKMPGSAGGVAVEDVIRAPRLVHRCTAASCWAVLSHDDACSICPDVGHKIEARYHGTITSHDSHSVNKALQRRCREQLPNSDFILSLFCIQHPTGTAVEHVTDFLDLLQGPYCSAKVFSDGTFFEEFRGHVRAIIARDLVVVRTSESECVSDADACFARTLLELCYVRYGLWPVDDEHSTARQQVAGEFLTFFRPPYKGTRRGRFRPSVSAMLI